MWSQKQRATEQARHSDIVAEAGRQLGLKVLLADYEILIALFEDGTVSAGELSTRCSYSNSAFYSALQNLAAQGLVIAEQSDHDHRTIIYSLHEKTRTVFNDRFKGLMKWFTHHLGASADAADIRINQFVRDIEQELKIRFLTPEYEFLLFLYEYASQTPSDIHSISKSSTSTLYNIIHRLRAKGIIEFEIDPQDKRRKIYHLTPQTRRIMDGTHQQLLGFLNNRFDPC